MPSDVYLSSVQRAYVNTTASIGLASIGSIDFRAVSFLDQNSLSFQGALSPRNDCTLSSQYNSEGKRGVITSVGSAPPFVLSVVYMECQPRRALDGYPLPNTV